MVFEGTGDLSLRDVWKEARKQRCGADGQVEGNGGVTGLFFREHVRVQLPSILD